MLRFPSGQAGLLHVAFALPMLSPSVISAIYADVPRYSTRCLANLLSDASSWAFRLVQFSTGCRGLISGATYGVFTSSLGTETRNLCSALQGFSFDAVAQQRRVQTSTVESYVAEAIVAGHAYDWQRCGVGAPELAAIAAFAAAALTSYHSGRAATAVDSLKHLQQQQQQQQPPQLPLPAVAAPLVSATPQAAPQLAATMQSSGVFADDSDEDLSPSQLVQLQGSLLPQPPQAASAQAPATSAQEAVAAPCHTRAPQLRTLTLAGAPSNAPDRPLGGGHAIADGLVSSSARPPLIGVFNSNSNSDSEVGLYRTPRAVPLPGAGHGTAAYASAASPAGRAQTGVLSPDSPQEHSCSPPGARAVPAVEENCSGGAPLGSLQAGIFDGNSDSEQELTASQLTRMINQCEDQPADASAAITAAPPGDAAPPHELKPFGEHADTPAQLQLSAALQALAAAVSAAIKSPVTVDTATLSGHSGCHGSSSNGSGSSDMGSSSPVNLATMALDAGIGTKAFKEGLTIGYGHIRLALAHLGRLPPIYNAAHAALQCKPNALDCIRLAQGRQDSGKEVGYAG